MARLGAFSKILVIFAFILGMSSLSEGIWASDVCRQRLYELAEKTAYSVDESRRVITQLENLDLDVAADVERVSRNVRLALLSPRTKFNVRRDILNALVKKLDVVENRTNANPSNLWRRAFKQSKDNPEIPPDVLSIFLFNQEARNQQIKHLNDVYDPAEYQNSLRKMLLENVRGLSLAASAGDYRAVQLLVEFAQEWLAGERPQYLEEAFEHALTNPIRDASGWIQFLEVNVLGAATNDIAYSYLETINQVVLQGQAKSPILSAWISRHSQQLIDKAAVTWSLEDKLRDEGATDDDWFREMGPANVVENLIEHLK